MNTIDSSFERPLNQPPSKIEARKETRARQTSSSQFSDEFAKEIVTEKNVTEVSLSILGLDFRQVTSAEKQYTKIISRDSSSQTQDTTLGEAALLNAEAGPLQEDREQDANENKVYRAYLGKDPANRTLHYLA